MKCIKTVDAVGHVLCHDMTQIIKDEFKGARFTKGHIVTEEDIPVLLSMGKENLYIWEKVDGMLHENEAAEILYEISVGKNEYIKPSAPKEGKIEAIALTDGLLTVDTEKLRALNSFGQMMIATRHSHFPVHSGDKLAGMRVTPLTIESEKIEKVRTVIGNETIISLNPFKRKSVGLIITGSEVFSGNIKDTFTPVLKEKLSEYDAEVTDHIILGDNPDKITQTVLEMLKKGADIVLCSGGMSVDPDDKTPLAIKNTGARIVSYGAPVLPGAMFLLAYVDAGCAPAVPEAKPGAVIMGLPGCVMYSKRTVFDLILPRIIADLEVTADDLASLGHGGLCLSCHDCTFPNCGFGKG